MVMAGPGTPARRCRLRRQAPNRRCGPRDSIGPAVRAVGLDIATFDGAFRFSLERCAGGSWGGIRRVDWFGAD